MLAVEAQKLRKIELGMTIAVVEALMSDSPMVFNAGTNYEQVTPRPFRLDKFVAKDGKSVAVYFYRSSVKRRDSVTSDDETTAVVFVDGKVDALLPGEKSKEVIEVRFR